MATLSWPLMSQSNISESRYDGTTDKRLLDGLMISLSPIKQLLEVADLCDVEKPDERSVMTYVASYFHAFSSMGMSLALAKEIGALTK